MNGCGVLFGFALLAFCLGAAGRAVQAADDKHDHPPKHMGAAMPSTCQVPVHVTEEAERQPGGALYQGPAVTHHGKLGADRPHMKGAHTDHRPRHGGAFFMAPDKIHHLEGTYSDRCGFRLYLYNAFTKPIGVGRFRAFIKIVPDSDDEVEKIRFLAPNKANTVLQAPPIGDAKGRFQIELYVKFPESDEPGFFTVHVPN